MSRENVEIVKAAYDAYNRKDWDALLKVVAPGFELDFSRALGPYRGVFGLDRRLWDEVRETWESDRQEPHEFIEAGDLVVVPSTNHAKGRGGIEVASHATWVWTIRNGAIERASMYQEKEDALEDLRLSETDSSSSSRSSTTSASIARERRKRRSRHRAVREGCKVGRTAPSRTRLLP